MGVPWSRRKLLITGSAAATGGVAAVAVTSPADAAPPPAPGINVVEAVTGRQVSVRARTAPSDRPRQFDGALRTLEAQALPYGWALRGGDLVLVEDSTGTAVAVPLHREVNGRVAKVAADAITVDGQQIRLDPRTLLYVGEAVEPLVGFTAHHLRAGDSVALQCLDNRRDGTLTVHFMRLLARA
ncbi:hypothetical protein [Micromonospora sp. 067-2]|uniref:hypothetical protein n=1 Tax=Micromonospora sp. 067-2 TaxID=2789270 RepID=UPI0039781F64